MDEIKKVCLHSLTIGWSYVCLVFGVALDSIDLIAVAVNDPSLKDEITQAFADPVIVGRVILAFTTITILSRLRSLRKTDVSNQ